MHVPPILNATSVETFWSAMPHLVGMLMVMITLAVLWGVCALTAFLVHRFMPAAAAPAPAAAPAAAQPHIPGTIPPQTVVAIAAAVDAILGKDHKIISIKSLDSTWEKAGRQSVLTSHRIR
jgi:hypothetical protein